MFLFCVCLTTQASEELLREHYSELRSKPFFRGLITYMSSGPVVAMVRLFKRFLSWFIYLSLRF